MNGAGLPVEKIERVQETQRMGAAMFEANPYINILFDDQYNLIDCNPAAIEYFGFVSKRDFLADFMPFLRNMLHPGRSNISCTALRKQFRRAAETGYTAFEGNFKLGEDVKSFSIVLKRIFYKNSFAIIAYLVDLTSIKETKEKLVKREHLLKAVNAAAMLLLSSDQDDFYRVMYRALEFLGHSVAVDRAYVWKNVLEDGRPGCIKIAEWDNAGFETYEGRDIKKMFYDEFLPQWREALPDQACINSLTKNLTGPLARMPGRGGARSLLMIPIILKGGFWGYIGFDDCIKERIFTAMEEGILRAGGTLIASAIDRNEMTLALIKAKENALAGTNAKTEFLSRMSHEIRTPMNAIIGMTVIAKKTKNPSKVYRCLDQIETSSRQLLSIINDVLDMSKIEANRLEIVNNEFNFEKLMVNIFNVIQVKLEEKHQHLFYNSKNAFTRGLISDELRLSQVLINLLTNAVKFTPDGGTITIVVQTSPAENETSLLRVSIQDTGIGITKEQQGRLFNSFEQADAEISRKFGGTGLGLAICKRIVTLMGGDIWVESEITKGSRFVFEIPIQWGGVIEDMSAESAPGQIDLAYRWKDKTILVVEDIEINREIISGVLEETGVSIENAGNGLEAVKLFEENPEKYDMILMDIQMPEMDGLEATRRIRAIEETWRKKTAPVFPREKEHPRGVPIIAMTANAFADDVKNCMDAGMNAHVSKPIEIDDLFSTISACLGR